MRSLRLVLPSQGIRVSSVLPWMTDTIMTSGFSGAWKAAGLPVNTATHVAEVALTVASDSSINGKSFYVEGGRAWEIEENIDRLEPLWLGEGPSRRLAQGQEFLGQVCADLLVLVWIGLTFCRAWTGRITRSATCSL